MLTFETVLVANRGEIAVRVMRTLRAMGVRSVAVYSDADAGALHVGEADMAIRIGPAAARDSYLSVGAVIAAAVASGAQAIHPGYGFLSENPALAAACADAGIAFIGPPASAIEAMGDKIAAKAMVSAAGVRVVPGSDGAGLDDAALGDAARRVGFPILIKPSAGGGGKGMRRVDDEAGLATAIESARREARNSFGDDTLLVERYVVNPRHIEIQVLADAHGHIVHLGERECSLQRRHQKIVEEAPSPLLTPALRAAMGEQAVAAARACGYVGAGTVEFIVSADQPDEFFFMEMNTRLQVEHPVTEMIYGLDLVELQVRVAAGEALPFAQDEVEIAGHAIEARIYAEDPGRGFLPTGGTVVDFVAPAGPGVRVDSGVAAGSVIGSDYDPMLAKLIAWGTDRDQALRRLERALAATSVLGVTTNIGFLRRLVSDPDVIAGRLDTGLVERRLDDLTAGDVPEAVLIVAALHHVLGDGGHTGPWHRLVGWRHHRRGPTRCEFDVDGHGRHAVSVTPGEAPGQWMAVVDGRPGERTVQFRTGPAGAGRLVLDGSAIDVVSARGDARLHLGIGGESFTLRPVEHRGGERQGLGSADSVVRSPMPGTIIAVHVEVGHSVAAGQVVAVCEAMKMEYSLRAGIEGVVSAVHVAAGGSVALDAPVVTIVAEPAPT
jgi:acetyl-CoA/propionyl-CoA carboxylase biotin carboxyl carrier protein